MQRVNLIFMLHLSWYKSAKLAFVNRSVSRFTLIMELPPRQPTQRPPNWARALSAGLAVRESVFRVCQHEKPARPARKITPADGAAEIHYSCFDSTLWGDHDCLSIQIVKIGGVFHVHGILFATLSVAGPYVQEGILAQLSYPHGGVGNRRLFRRRGARRQWLSGSSRSFRRDNQPYGVFADNSLGSRPEYLRQLCRGPWNLSGGRE